MAATVAEGVCDVCRSNKVDRIEDTCEVFLFIYLFTGGGSMRRVP